MLYDFRLAKLTIITIFIETDEYINSLDLAIALNRRNTKNLRKLSYLIQCEILWGSGVTNKLSTKTYDFLCSRVSKQCAYSEQTKQLNPYALY